MDRESELREAIRSGLAGQAVLFLGAGAAKDAKNKQNEALPVGQQLADALAQECGLGNGYALDAIAEHFIEKKSETSLINELRKRLNIADVGETLTLLGEMDWLRIWTTNYDNAFEAALDIRTTESIFPSLHPPTSLMRKAISYWLCISMVRCQN